MKKHEIEIENSKRDEQAKVEEITLEKLREILGGGGLDPIEGEMTCGSYNF
jgi:hypothetical protein